MKKKELEKLEEINQKRKLSPEVKKIIAKKATNNFLVAIDILLLFIILMFSARNFNKEITTTIYKVCSAIMFLFTLVLFEIAYNNDDDISIVNALEMFILSIATLLTPYFYISKPNIATSIVGIYFSAYYIIKNLVIYKKEKNKYIRNKDDISEIIKKESQDEHAIKIKEEKAKEKEQEITKDEPVKRKRGRPRKVVSP